MKKFTEWFFGRNEEKAVAFLRENLPGFVVEVDQDHSGIRIHKGKPYNAVVTLNSVGSGIYELSFSDGKVHHSSHPNKWRLDGQLIQYIMQNAPIWFKGV